MVLQECFLTSICLIIFPACLKELVGICFQQWKKAADIVYTILFFLKSDHETYAFSKSILKNRDDTIAQINHFFW